MTSKKQSMKKQSMSKKVKNINGTTDNSCKCGSWLRHWEKYGGIMAGLCVEKSCTQNVEAGARVLKGDGSADESWYIVPLCKEHNALLGKEIEIRVSAKMVPADTKETCARE